MKTTFWAWSCLGLTALVSTGCENKIGQCNALIDQINASHAVIEEGSDFVAHPEKLAQGLKTFNEHVEAEAKKIEQVELKDEKLKDFSRQYISMMREVAAVISSLGEVTMKLPELQKKAEEQTKTWTTAMTKLRVDCLKQAAQCKELAETLGKPPMITGLKPAEDVKKLQEFAKNIAAPKLEEGDLKTTRDGLVSSLNTFAEAMSELADVMAKAEESSQALNAAAGKESPIVDGINGYCGAG